MEKARDHPEPPPSVGPYRIASRIGGGGMGEVYRAYDERLERWVAIKQLRPDVARKKFQRERFRREARAVASLNHPAIVQIFDILEDTPWGDWIVMELVEGKTLKEALASGSFSVGKVIHLGSQIAEGLAVAHANGIVHRDLKVENVMVMSPTRDRVKILDFGLAKDFDRTSDSSSISGVGAVLGTSRAMSPEQVMGHEVDPRSDLFSLGILLFEVTTGESPFRAANSILTLARVCNHTQPPISEIRPEVPEALSDLIDRLLEKDKEHRPQTADEVGRILRDLAERISASESDTASAVAVPISDNSRSSSSSQSGFYIKTLLLISLVDHNRWMDEMGETRGYQILSQFDRLTRDLLAKFRGLEVQKTDGFLLLFERPADAVDFVLLHQARLRRLSKKLGIRLRARAAVHVGEVLMHENVERDVAQGAKHFEVEGRAKRTAQHLLALARPSQVLLTREACELAKRAFERRSSSLERATNADVIWESHGEYLLEGIDRRVPVYEVGRPGLAPLLAPRRPQKQRRRVGMKWLFLVLVLLAALGGWLAKKYWPPLSEARISVAVLGFKNLSGDSESAWHSTALSELLATELAVGGELRLIPGESIARMKRDLGLEETEGLANDTLAAIGLRLGTSYVVVGSYLVLEEEARKLIHFRPVLRDVQSHEVVVGPTFEGSEIELIDLVSRTGREFRRYLGVHEPSPAEVGAVRSTLPSMPAAARPYSEGLAKLRAYDALGARELLEHSISIDADFALAHAALSEAWAQLGYARNARASAEKATELARGLPRREELQIEGRGLEVSKEWEKAVKTYEALWKFFDEDLEYGLRLAMALTEYGKIDQALEIVAELRQLATPMRDDPRIDMAQAGITKDLGDYPAMLESARMAEEKALALGARILVGDALQSQAWALRQLGHADQAMAAFEAARDLYRETGLRASEAEVFNGLAILQEDAGDLDDAEEMFQKSLDIHREIGNESWQATLLANLGFLYEARGELVRGERMGQKSAALFAKIGDQREEQIQREYRVKVLVARGQLRQARALVEDYRRSSTPFQRDHEVWRDFMEAELMLAEGQPEGALPLLQATLRLLPEVQGQSLLVSLHHLSGRVHLALDQLEEAEAHLETARSIGVESGLRVYLALIELTRATLHRRRGDLEGAEKMALAARHQLMQSGSLDAVAEANLEIALVLSSRGDLVAARESQALASARARVTENPSLRLANALVAVQVWSTDGPEAPLQGLEAALEEARKLGFGGFEAQIRTLLEEKRSF